MTTGSNILVVDDDPAVLSMLRRALVLTGFAVDTAPDGESALMQAEASQPDMVILDVMLPGIDGFTVVERLRASSQVPVLMLTARDTVPDRVTGLERGADD